MAESKLEPLYTEVSHVKDGIADLVAGTMGGIANVAAGQPLDTVKVKLQTFPTLYQTGVKCFVETLRMEGIRGLYAGTVPALTANVAENAVLFTAYGYCQKTVAFFAGRSSPKEMMPVENAIAGSLASVFAAIVLCPTELVKCKLQAHRELCPNVRKSPLSLCRDLYRMHGLRAFYTGMVATLCREIPGYFFFFGGYELSRFYLTPKGKAKDEIGIVKTALSGGVGGLALWAAVYPIDLVKSRMQVSGSGDFTKMLLSIIKNEGIRTLYKGLTFTLIRSFWATGCLFVTYENTKLLF